MDLEDLGPFGATERHQIIKGNVGEIGKNVRIIRKRIETLLSVWMHMEQRLHSQ